GAVARHRRAHASSRLLVGTRAGHLAVAPSGALPARAAHSGLARDRARDLLRRRAALLVARGATVAEPGTVAALDDPGLPAARRRAEHGVRRPAGVLGTAPLPGVCDRAAPRRAVGTRRPGRRRADHVGARIGHPAGAGGRDHAPPAVA